MNKVAIICLTLCSLVAFAFSEHESYSIYYFGAGAIALYTFESFFNQPEKFKPTLEKLNATTITPIDANTASISIYDYMEKLGSGQYAQSQNVLVSSTNKCHVRVEQGIDLTAMQPHEPVLLFSPYFLPALVKHPEKLQFYIPSTPGRSFYTAGYYLKNKTIPTTCITFDYRDTRTAINVGQSLDQQCLSLITDEIVRQEHPFILFGCCRGAINILKFITEKPTDYLEKNLRAVIVESPALSLKDICEQTVRSRPILNLLPHDAGSAALYTLLRWALPNHAYQESTILANIDNIPKDLPMLIIQVKNDTLVAEDKTKKLVKKLVETGHSQVHLLVFTDKNLNHYTISTASLYPAGVNAFLQHYGLPHNATLAAQGYDCISFITQPLSCPTGMSAKDYIQQVWDHNTVNPDGSSVSTTTRVIA